MVNKKDEYVFDTPQWLLDWHSEASKKCPSFSLAEEFRKIDEAKARGEDPLQSVYHISEDDLEKHPISNDIKAVKALQIRDTERQAVVPKRKASASTAEILFYKNDRAKRASKSSSSPTESSFAESSRAGAERGLSTMLNNPVGNQSAAQVVKSEVHTIYKAKDLPQWLTVILTTTLNRELKRVDKQRIQALRAIDAFKDCIRRCEVKPESKQSKLFEELRDHVHKAEITLKGVDKYVVRKANMLTVENGLPRIFLGDKVDYPWDLRADAWQLYLRWYRQDFKPDLLRGIVTRKGKDRTSDSIDPEWLKNTASYYGEGDLVLGQWWPTQLCALRDGAHGSTQGGIWGEKGKGAYSIVLSSGGYKDKDDGNEIWYSGTDNRNPNLKDPTENTQRLIESCDELPNQPVRVLRSSQLPMSNPYRPKYGLRYDGLYTVVAYEVLDISKQQHLFKLIRCQGQNPIRCEDNAARRPTKFEEAEFERLKRDGR